MLQAQLRVLLQELSNVRSDAATVAAGGSPNHWWRSEPLGAQQVEAEPIAAPVFVCPHLSGEATFGQAEPRTLRR